MWFGVGGQWSIEVIIIIIIKIISVA